MLKIDPIIAVQNMPASSLWYRSIFGWKSKHGGDGFDILTGEMEEVFLCLHKWDIDDHPPMQNQSTKPGHGLILYFRTDKFSELRDRIAELGYAIDQEVHLNQNSRRKEFSLHDPDGYYLTITEYHRYEG